MRRVERVVEVVDPTLPRSLSPTSASTWLQCELKYALTYIYGWRESHTLPQVIGNVVHRCVELLYALPPTERIRSTASDLLRSTYAEDAADWPRDDVLLAGEDALDGLFVLEDPRRVRVGDDGLEVWVRAELYGVPVGGRIDRIYDADGAEVVADYKTGRTPAPAYTQRAFFGLWTYAAALAAEDAEHRLADRIELLYLRGRERLSRPVLRDVALEHAKDLSRIWKQVNTATAATSFTARTSKLCDWCAFQPACPAFGPTAQVGTPEHDAALDAAGLIRSERKAVAEAAERLEPAGA